MDAQQPIDVAAGEFDRTGVAERAAKAESERQALVQRFPMDAWPEMPLEEYALGQERSEDTFCRWLEFRTPTVASMKGGSARKHLIYKHAQKPGWYFDSDFESETAAWESLRSGFVDAFNKAQAGEWNAIDDIAVLEGGQALRSKTLYCYFPDELLPINSYAHLKHFFQCVRPEDFDSSFGIIRLNRRLLEILRSIAEFSGWSNWEMMVFLYHWADPRESRRILKIAPGENAMYWEDCLAYGYICVGWDEVGDLSQFESKDEFFARYPTYSQPASIVSSLSCWT